MKRPASTADLRRPTGLDRVARRVLLRVLSDAGVDALGIVNAFLRDQHFADLRDYLRAVREVWGGHEARDLRDRVLEYGAFVYRDRVEEPGIGEVPDGFESTGFLLEIPEPDFLTAMEIGTSHVHVDQLDTVRSQITAACKARGIPYEFSGKGSTAGFRWTGDATVQREALEPALSALNDPRLKGGPKREFDAARNELRQATPGALKQAVAEACNAVESALKVLLQAHGQSLPAKQTLDPLLNACVQAGLLAAETRELIAGPGRFGNRRGRHGAGAVAHNVSREEAETVVSAAAVAITFIAKRLP